MIRTIAIQGYRSIRDLVLPLGQLSVVTGANGSGKSNIYRSLHLLADAAQNAVVGSLAREGGLPSTFWAGPETIARSVRQGEHKIEPLAGRNSASLMLGFGGDLYGYSIDLGYPIPSQTMFGLDPRIKRECIWNGPLYRRASAMVDRRNNFVWLSTTRDEEPVMLTQHLADTDSMLASIPDPQRAPEMLAVRESIRSWRFYDHFRTDADSPVRTAQIGTFSPVLHLTAALLTPRPPELLVLNEPETSLHPDLLPALARLIRAASRNTQIIIVSHAQALVENILAESGCAHLHLIKSFGETTLESATLFNTPKWAWPAR
ncbi:AAA family ATPase [Terriglobus sp. YAF25]|uniref:AAA family ATPase n=1 Tax=Terriglobus sp. YAF25 TaxID=3233080 RepID=UPI003F9CCF23